MAELVSSLLILARIDEGLHQQHEGKITDTASTLHDIARHWRIAAAQAGLVCTPRIPDDLPDIPLTPHDLRLVLDNLLGNAIKYTPQGEVSLTVRRDAGEMVIQVQDTGVGFDSTHAEQLFTRFYRADEIRTHIEGNGLGLSIARAVLEQYGGTISASSEGTGKGATFTVMVPSAGYQALQQGH